jgi:Amt family ammonium transporter
MTVLGAGLLWFGWFGFNAGSALGANGLASLALVNTHIAAAAGAFGWAVVEMMRIKKVTMLGVASGLVAGLVGITPAAGFVDPMWAIVIGLGAGIVCYGGVLLKGKFGYDDALDAFGVHGIGGALGAVLTGVFATAALDPGKKGGLIEGNFELFTTQLIGVAAAAAYSAVVTAGILYALKLTIGLRVDKETEIEGLDATLHGEAGYALGAAGGSHVAPESEVEMDAAVAAKPAPALAQSTS